MNKQELIEKVEGEKFINNRTDFEIGYNLASNNILRHIKQLDKPEKVIIPQFVADWIEEAKKSCKDVADLFDFDFTNEEAGKWFMQEQPFDLIARAWLNGYIVEDEKRYTVKMKGVNDYGCYLNKGLLSKKYFWESKAEIGGCRTKHTRKELEDAGFGEVFNSPLFEVEEVE